MSTNIGHALEFCPPDFDLEFKGTFSASKHASFKGTADSKRHDPRFQKSEVGSCPRSYQLVAIGRTYGNFQLLISENEGHVFSNPLYQ